MLCMARCSSQSTVLTTWVLHWLQTPPGRLINITNKTSRTLGFGKNPEDQLFFSKRQLSHQSGVCKLYLGPKHQADQLTRVCTAKGSIAHTTEMPQQIQCQQHAGNAGLTISPTWAQESKTGNFYKFHHQQGSIASDTKWIPGYCPSVTRAHHSHSLLYPVTSCQTDYRKFSFFWMQSRIGMTSLRMWTAAPTLETFCSHLPKLVPFRVGYAPPVSSVDDGLGLCWSGFCPRRPLQ